MANVPENALLGRVAMNWTTPSASDGERAGTVTEAMTGTSLTQQVNTLWSTPRASDSEKGCPNQSFTRGGTPPLPLPAQAMQWATPCVRDYRGADSPDHVTKMKAAGHGMTILPNQVTQWMTPRVSETGQYQYSKGNHDDPVLTLQGQSQAMTLRSILPDRPISTVGEESSHIRRTLNPPFVEWLMGWPRDWTLLALMPPASNACACSATALFLWRQRMRSELYALGLPGAAQPAQLGLFV